MDAQHEQHQIWKVACQNWFTRSTWGVDVAGLKIRFWTRDFLDLNKDVGKGVSTEAADTAQWVDLQDDLLFS